jgi:hypothetical protein
LSGNFPRCNRDHGINVSMISHEALTESPTKPSAAITHMQMPALALQFRQPCLVGRLPKPDSDLIEWGQMCCYKLTNPFAESPQGGPRLIMSEIAPQKIQYAEAMPFLMFLSKSSSRFR